MTDDYKIWQIIAASSVGTMIEWYDFYIFGSLATVIAPLFYPQGNNTLALIAYLSTFAVGFVVRPFGALFFGRIGDLVGRKYAFLVTLLIMGGATALIGFLPTYPTIGIAAPILLLLIRILQGLALGGEYGGAAVYVAEHVPDGKRGFYTSFIQITATLGLFLSLIVILVVQNEMSREAFSSWGWRIPFLVSILLVSVSLYIRMRMKESPIFQHIKSTGMTSAKPLKEAFAHWKNLRLVLISLFGATAGQGVVHGPVLRAVLSADDSKSERHVRVLHSRRIAVAGHAFLCAVRSAIGSHRTKEDHDGGMPARGALVLADLSHHAEGRRFERRHRAVTAERGDWSHRTDATGGARRKAAARKRSPPVQRLQKFHHQLGFDEPHRADVHSGDIRHDGLWTNCGLSRRSISGEDPIHGAFTSLSHRQWRVRRIAAGNRPVGHRQDRKYLRGPLLPHHRGVRDVCDRIAAAEGNSQHLDLERAGLEIDLVFDSDTHRLGRCEERVWINVSQRCGDGIRNSEVAGLHRIEKLANFPPYAFLIAANAADRQKPAHSGVFGRKVFGDQREGPDQAKVAFARLRNRRQRRNAPVEQDVAHQRFGTVIGGMSER